MGNKTIHGLIYNALKLFMEMNQKLFDECTQQYKAERLKEKEKARQRLEAWGKVENIARKNPDVEEVAKMLNNVSLINSRLPTSTEENEDGVVQETQAVAANGVPNFTVSAAAIEANKKSAAEKPLLRRKSELPTDIFTQKALENHQRKDEYLSTPPDTNTADTTSSNSA